MTREEILNAMVAADKAGDEAGAQQLYDLLQQMPADGQQQQQMGPQDPADIGQGSAAWQGAKQGATFGFSDEIYGGTRAFFDTYIKDMFSSEDGVSDEGLAERYKRFRDEQRGLLESARFHHPGTTMAAEFVPGLLQGGAGIARSLGGAATRAGLKAAGQQTLKASRGKLAKLGAGFGGTAGLGYSEADTLGGLAKDTAIGAGMGGVIAPAVPAIGSGLKRGYQNVARRFGSDAGKASARRAAHTDIMIAMEKDRQTVGSISEKFADDPLATMMEAGPHLRQQAKLIARQPGQGGVDILEEVTRRQQAAPGRIKPMLRGFMEDTDLGTGDLKTPGNFAEAEHAIMNRARKVAEDEQLWEKAYRGDFDMPRPIRLFLKRELRKDGTLGAFDNPEAGRAHNVAIRNLNRRVNMGEIVPDDPGMNARYTDQVMRALKADISMGANPLSKLARTGEETMLMSRQHKQLMKSLKAEGVMPDEWHRGRSLWAGESANEEALQAGKRVMSEHVDDLTYGLKQMSASEQDHFLVGALKTIEGMLAKGTKTGDILRRLRSTDHGNQLMRLLAGSEKKFQRFLKNAEREFEYLMTHKKLTGGSDTFENLVGEAASKGGVQGTLAGIVMQQSKWGRALGGLPLIGRTVGRRIAGTAARKDEAKRNEMAKMLLSRDPGGVSSAMQQPLMPLSPMLGTLGLGAASKLPGLLE